MVYHLQGRVDRIPVFVGKHFWTANVVYEVRDPIEFIQQTNGPVLLDYENLVLGPTLGCFYCEQMFSLEIAYLPCEGSD